MLLQVQNDRAAYQAALHRQKLAAMTLRCRQVEIRSHCQLFALCAFERSISIYKTTNLTFN